MRRSRCGPLLPHPLRLTHALLVFTYPSRSLQVPSPPTPPSPLLPPTPPPHPTPTPTHPPPGLHGGGWAAGIAARRDAAPARTWFAKRSPARFQLRCGPCHCRARAVRCHLPRISPCISLHLHLPCISHACPSALQLPCISLCICPCIYPCIYSASPMHLPCVSPCICRLASALHLPCISLYIAHAPVRHLVSAAPHTHASSTKTRSYFGCTRLIMGIRTLRYDDLIDAGGLPLSEWVKVAQADACPLSSLRLPTHVPSRTSPTPAQPTHPLPRTCPASISQPHPAHPPHTSAVIQVRPAPPQPPAPADFARQLCSGTELELRFSSVLEAPVLVVPQRYPGLLSLATHGPSP